MPNKSKNVKFSPEVEAKETPSCDYCDTGVDTTDDNFDSELIACQRCNIRCCQDCILDFIPPVEESDAVAVEESDAVAVEESDAVAVEESGAVAPDDETEVKLEEPRATAIEIDTEVDVVGADDSPVFKICPACLADPKSLCNSCNKYIAPHRPLYKCKICQQGLCGDCQTRTECCQRQTCKACVDTVIACDQCSDTKCKLCTGTCVRCKGACRSCCIHCDGCEEDYCENCLDTSTEHGDATGHRKSCEIKKCQTEEKHETVYDCNICNGCGKNGCGECLTMCDCCELDYCSNCHWRKCDVAECQEDFCCADCKKHNGNNQCLVCDKPSHTLKSMFCARCRCKFQGSLCCNHLKNLRGNRCSACDQKLGRLAAQRQQRGQEGTLDRKRAKKQQVEGKVTREEEGPRKVEIGASGIQRFSEYSKFISGTDADAPTKSHRCTDECQH
jgi:hypothetical protein